MSCVDSDVCIDYLRGVAEAQQWFTSLSDPPIICGLVLMELYQSATDKVKQRQIDAFVRAVPVVWPSEADCDRALQDFRQFYLSHNLGFLDSLIGECAVGLNAPLYTFNVKHYRVIPNLTLTTPYTRP